MRSYFSGLIFQNVCNLFSKILCLYKPRKFRGKVESSQNPIMQLCGKKHKLLV